MSHLSGAEYSLQDQLDRAENLLSDGKRDAARDALNAIVHVEVDADDADGIRAKELATYRLGDVLALNRDGAALVGLLTTLRPFFGVLPKAKATKMTRKLFLHVMTSGVSLDTQREVCLETIAWARREKRTFLRHRIQHRLAEVQLQDGQPREALATVHALLKEVRRLDDRALLLDVHLLESTIYNSIHDVPKARAALVAARTNASSIYCPPLAQAEIDLQSGILHARENDPKTAYSYLYEAFEGFHQLGDHAVQARRALHYLVLCKIAMDVPDELASLLATKNVLEYSGPDMDALRGLADAYAQHDAHRFHGILNTQRGGGGGGGLITSEKAPASAAVEDGASASQYLLRDEGTRRQLEDMYAVLVERHLLRIVEPYNRVQLSHLAQLMQMDVEELESRLSGLILDKKLYGIVDQHHSCLVVFDAVEVAQQQQQQAAAAGGAPSSSASGGDGASGPHHSTGVGSSGADLHRDVLETMERYDKLVTALFDKVGGKFDALVEERLQKRKGGSGAAAAAAGKDGGNKAGAAAAAAASDTTGAQPPAAQGKKPE